MTQEKRYERRNVLKLVGAAGTGGLAGCTGDNGNGGSDPLRVGISLSLSGDYSSPATQMRNGYELWAQQVNANGGIDGHEVELQIYDDESSSSRASQLAQRLIEQDDVDVIFGPYATGLSLAMAQVAEEHEVPILVTMGAGNNLYKQGFQYINGVIPTATEYHTNYINMVMNEFDASQFAVLWEDVEVFAIGKDAAIEQIENNGGEVRDWSYTGDNPDFNSTVNEMSSYDPDSVITISYFPESSSFLQTAISAGFSPDSICNTGSFLNDDIIDSIDAENARYLYDRTAWSSQATSEMNQQFTSAYEDEYDETPVYYSAYAYMAGQITQGAVQEAGSVKPQELNEAYRTMTTETLGGTYEVNDETGIPEGISWFILQRQGEDASERALVAPQEVRSSDPLYPVPSWDER